MVNLTILYQHQIYVLVVDVICAHGKETVTTCLQCPILNVCPTKTSMAFICVLRILVALKVKCSVSQIGISSMSSGPWCRISCKFVWYSRGVSIRVGFVGWSRYFEGFYYFHLQGW